MFVPQVFPTQRSFLCVTSPGVVALPGECSLAKQGIGVELNSPPSANVDPSDFGLQPYFWGGGSTLNISIEISLITSRLCP